MMNNSHLNWKEFKPKLQRLIKRRTATDRGMWLTAGRPETGATFRTHAQCRGWPHDVMTSSTGGQHCVARMNAVSQRLADA